MKANSPGHARRGVNYYNEFDPFAAQWLRELIKAGLIPAGDVDDRSIKDVQAGDLRGYTQCHFFAGIGGWPLALQLAGWRTDRPVWSGSCPCQPFSAAGKGAGFSDDRHLWPDFQRLIAECEPAVVFGEQVASKAADAWFDLVQADVEALGYAFGVVAFPAASVGAPHIRDRAYWVADATRQRCGETRVEHRGRSAQRPGDGREPVGLAHSLPTGRPEGWSGSGHRPIAGSGEPQRLADAHDQGPQGWSAVRQRADQRAAGQSGVAGRLADACSEHLRRGLGPRDGAQGPAEGAARQRERSGADTGGRLADGGPGPVNGFWRDADWLLCRDGKFRPVEPLPQQMVDGLPESLGRLRECDTSEITKEVMSYAEEAGLSAREAMLDVWLSLGAETIQRTAGRFDSVQEAPFLLAFLRQLADQGWEIAQGLPRPSPQTPERYLRVLWEQVQATRAPHQRGLDGQPTGEYSNTVRVLSSILARHAQAAWGEAFGRHVSDAFPLIQGAPNRVGKLRGYGNAIVPQQAAEFVSAFMDYQRAVA